MIHSNQHCVELLLVQLCRFFVLSTHKRGTSSVDGRSDLFLLLLIYHIERVLWDVARRIFNRDNSYNFVKIIHFRVNTVNFAGGNGVQ